MFFAHWSVFDYKMKLYRETAINWYDNLQLKSS